MNHVRKFMQVLAEKISELGATPLYWTSAQGKHAKNRSATGGSNALKVVS
jgi:hypothetical protein